MAPNNFFCGLAQAFWMGTCLEEAGRFKRAARSDLRAVQGNVLREIIKNSGKTEYGQKHCLAGLRCIADFQKAVPVNEYDDLEPFIKRIAEGNSAVLTEDKVLMFEETSGTTCGSRLIPYTGSLQSSFNRGLHPWLLNLHMNLPGIWGGPAYWVVTPRIKDRATSGGIKIGFASDSDYFGSWARPMIKAITIVEESAAAGAEIEDWRYYSILQLLRSENLRLISLWNPAFFLALVRSMIEWQDQLHYDLDKGSCRVTEISCDFSAMPKRAAAFKNALKALSDNDKEAFGRLLWPNLNLISAWQEAGARSSAEELKGYFPNVFFQTKGLLATEGVVTLPMFGAPAAVLAARSAFYEFEQGEEGVGAVCTADQLETGARYRVIMTTFGGLFRYRLHDIVEVKGWWHNLPALAFIGKEAMVSDLCGEKLNSAHVKCVIERLLGPDASAFLAPEISEPGQSPGYALFAAMSDRFFDRSAAAERLEMMLCENIHYRWARQAGQLKPAVFKALPVNRHDFELLWLKRLEQMKKPVSTAKFGALSRLDGWQQWFDQQINGPQDPGR